MSLDCPEHDAAAAFLNEAIEGDTPWCLAWPVVYEFLRVSTRPKALSIPLSASQALEFIHVLLESPTLSLLKPTERHEAVLRKTVGELAAPRGRLFHDIQIAVLMREHGVPEVITADTDFHQFKFLKVTNPVHPPGA